MTDYDWYLNAADQYLDEQAERWEADNRAAGIHEGITVLASARATSGADVAAAHGRYLPAPIRLDRCVPWWRRLFVTDRRRAQRADARARWALDVCEEAAARSDADALRSDLDAIAGDTDRALGPGWRKP